MQYENIIEGNFISRPNRFIAEVEVNSKMEICHVKNTGRCKELLIKGCKVFINEVKNKNRKTKYDLVNVYKGNMLINLDSQMPNKVFEQYLKEGKFLKDITYIKRESTYKNSRFDFYVETLERKIYIEIKGVTLEDNGVALFPDAPTTRGVKHIRELIDAKENGFETYIVFIIQFKGAKYFTPNKKRDEDLYSALLDAKERDVNIVALDCIVTKNEIMCDKYVEVRI